MKFVRPTRLRHGSPTSETSAPAPASAILRLRSGLLGDAKFFDGIGELRIDYGPGYRVYLVRRGDVLVILLCGGDKRSQRRDIKRAKAMAKELED